MIDIQSKNGNSKFFLLTLLGMLTAFGPFVTDMYLPSLPSMGEYFKTTPSLVQLGLTASMIGLAAGEIFLYRFYYEPSFIPSSHRLGALRRSLRNTGESPFRHQKRYGGLHHLQPRRRVPPGHMQQSGKLPLRNLVRQREEQGTLHGSQSPGLLPAP